MKTFFRSTLTNVKNLRHGKRDRGFISFAIALAMMLGITFNANAQENRKDTITILTFNDFHGAFLKDGDTPGAARFVSDFLKLKASVPNPVVVSGGDNFSGSFFSLMTKGEPHEVFTKIAGSQDKIISAVGNHEFDWGSDYFLKNNTRYIDYVGSNVSLNNDTISFKEDIVPYYRIVEFYSGDQKLDVGIIGLSTPTTPKSGKKPYVDDYKFDSVDGSSIMKIGQWLRDSYQANMVILLMHIGTCMKDGVPVIHSGDEDSAEELRRVNGYWQPIDGIVSAHSHDLVKGDFATYGKQVPLIQAGSNGTHIGMIQYELEGRNVRCIKNELIKVNTDAVPDPYIDSLVNKIIEDYGFNKEMATVKKEMSHSRDSDLHKFTEVGAIVTASYINEMNQQKHPEAKDKPVIAVHHFKGIRSGLPQGSLKKAIAGNVLPFGGNLGVYNATGAQIRDLFEQGFAQKSRGRLQTCNMKFDTKDGKITSMKLWRKETGYIEITDDMECILMCDDYIAYGGDDYEWKLGKEVEWFDKTVTTDSFLNFIESEGIFPNDHYKVVESTEVKRKNRKIEHPAEKRQTGDMRLGQGAAL